MPHTLMVWGNNQYQQISAAPVSPEKVRAIASGGSVNGLALRLNHTPIFWGDSSTWPDGALGPPPMPGALATEKFKAVALGRDDAVLIRENGTLAAFGRTEAVTAVTNVPGGAFEAVAVGYNAVAIAKGNDEGTLKTWGNDSYTDQTLAVTGLLKPPQGDGFKEVAARSLYSLALHEDRTLYFWGRAPGPAGGPRCFPGWERTQEDPNIFFFPGQKFTAIAAGNKHALAIKPDGKLMGWASNPAFALNPPTHVRFTAVAAGWGFSIGLDTNRTLWGWGTPVKPQPTSPGWDFASQGWEPYGGSQHYFVPEKQFESIAAAAFHFMAITHGP